jgi:hypothetical protein
VTFPVEQSAANTTQTTNATAWGSQNMPSGIVVGNTLLALVAVDGANRTVTESVWTKLLDGAAGSDGSVTLAVFWRKATASNFFSPVISSAEQGSCRIIRIDTAEDPATQPPEIGAVTTGASGIPPVGLITPTGGIKDYKFYSVCAHDRNRSFTRAPSFYTDNDATLVSGGANGAQLSWGDRDLRAISENPDNFVYGTSDGFATVVVAIHPAPLTGAISATVPMAFDKSVADLEAKGKLDALVAMVMGAPTVDLQDATGVSPISATAAMAFAKSVADLEGKGKLNATVAMAFAKSVADLEGKGKLDAIVAMAFAKSLADLEGKGKLDATVAMAFAKSVADLEGKGKLNATVAMAFAKSVADLKDLTPPEGAMLATVNMVFGAPTVDLEGTGKLDATAALLFDAPVVDLEGKGKLDATVAMAFAKSLADLEGKGKLDALATLAFGAPVVDLTNASAGAISAMVPMVFNKVLANLVDATPLIGVVSAKRHLGPFLVVFTS